MEVQVDSRRSPRHDERDRLRASRRSGRRGHFQELGRGERDRPIDDPGKRRRPGDVSRGPDGRSPHHRRDGRQGKPGELPHKSNPRGQRSGPCANRTETGWQIQAPAGLSAARTRGVVQTHYIAYGSHQASRLSIMGQMRITQLAATLALLALVSVDASADEPYGLTERTPWTTSRFHGQPEPPPPFRAPRVYPNLHFDGPTVLTGAQGTGRWFVAERLGK